MLIRVYREFLIPTSKVGYGIGARIAMDRADARWHDPAQIVA
jgi:hypothetical protein